MMVRTGWLATAAALAMMTATSAAAQRFSEGYRYIEAVRKADGAEVTKILNNPSSRIIDARTDTGEGALHIVAKRSDPTYLGFLLSRGANPNLQDGQGDTPLMAALQVSFLSGVETLIARKADVNLANNSGETPLIRAVQLRNLEAVQMLLAAGADPDKTDNVAGMSARDYARVDTRAPAISKLLADAPKVQRRAAAGPKLR